MKLTNKRWMSLTAIVLVVAIMQAFVGISYAASALNEDSTFGSDEPTGILTTRGNKPIMVNGAAAASGATIMSGAVVETTDEAAPITIPGHGFVNVPANSKLTINWDKSGNINVNIATGCAVLHTEQGTSGLIENANGVVGKTDGVKEGFIDACNPGSSAAPAGGLSKGAKIGIGVGIGGGVALILYFALRGHNPSPFR